jgi:hypothetical protein
VRANQTVDALKTRNYVLQCAITCVAIGTAAVEFLNRPIGNSTTIIDWNDDYLRSRFAVRKGLQIYDQQPFDLFSGYAKFIHV